MAETQTRSCGTCHACCIEADIPELNKPVGKPCQHLTQLCAAGCCSIYANKPKPCSGFECAWKLGFLGDDMRPDQSGVFFEATRMEYPRELIALIGSELRDGARELAQDQIASSLSEGVVALVINRARDGMTLIGSEEDATAFAIWEAACNEHGSITIESSDGVQTEIDIAKAR